MILRTFIAALVLVVPGPLTAAPDPAQVEAVLRPALARTPGIVAFVVHGGDVVFMRAYGLADVGRGVPMTVTTPLPLDSLSKQLTAAVVMRLRAHGELAYDDPLDRFLPEIGAHGVTLRSLLRHRSGLPDHGADANEPGTLEALVQAYAADHRQEADAPYRYNNGGYGLLAAAVERVAHESFAATLRETIFEPLEMHDTRLVGPAERAPAGLAHTYRNGEEFEAPVASQGAGGGAIVTTAADLAKWYQALDRDPAYRDLAKQIAAIDGAVRHDAGLPGYAAGWVLGASRGTERWSHGGSWRGSKNYVLRYPRERLTVVLLANGYEFGPERHRTAYRIASLFLPQLRVGGPVVATWDDDCARFGAKRSPSGGLVVEGAEDLATWRESGRWMHDPWPYGSQLLPTATERCPPPRVAGG